MVRNFRDCSDITVESVQDAIDTDEFTAKRVSNTAGSITFEVENTNDYFTVYSDVITGDLYKEFGIYPVKFRYNKFENAIDGETTEVIIWFDTDVPFSNAEQYDDSKDTDTELTDEQKWDNLLEAVADGEVSAHRTAQLYAAAHYALKPAIEQITE